MAEQRHAVDAALRAPLLERVDEPGLGLGDLAGVVARADAEGRAAAVAHAEHVEREQPPAGPPREALVVAVEEAEAGAVAVQHDQVVGWLLLARPRDGELVEGAVLAGEGDELGGPFPGAVGVGGGVVGKVFDGGV